MIHHNIVKNKEQKKITRTEQLNYTGEFDSEGFSKYLQREFNLSGKRYPPQRLKDNRWKFRYFHPGNIYDAIVSAKGDSVEITHQKGYARTIIIGFHRIHGYGGGWLYNIWAFIYDLVCISMILFAVTGIVIWYKNTKRRMLGWVLLTISFCYAAITVLYLAHSL